MINATGPTINSLSVMPLHLALGLALQIVNLCEEAAAALDGDIRKAKGQTSDTVTQKYRLAADLANKKNQVEENLNHCTVQVADMQEQIVDMTHEHPEFHQRVEGHLVDRSKEAVEARKHLRQLKSSKNQLDKELKVKQQQLNDIEKEIKQIEEFIEKEKGPFLEKFHNTMEQLNLKRQVYHKGALIGKDVEKIFGSQGQVIRNKISHVFHPQDIAVENETVRTFGSYMLAQKKRTLMEKFSAIYVLMAPSRLLCRHEVTLLKARCYSFGNWFPFNYPATGMKRKFHIVTHHVPEKAELRATVGMEAEHISESIHPVINRLKRRYSTVQSLKDQLPLICKDQWLLTNPKVPDYRQPKKRNKKN